MSWTIEGTYFEGCNRTFACPCLKAFGMEFDNSGKSAFSAPYRCSA